MSSIPFDPAVAESSGQLEAVELDRSIAELNGDLFWAPASGFTGYDRWVNVFGDELRSVFGSVPLAGCENGSTSILHAESGGNLVRLSRQHPDEYGFTARGTTGLTVTGMDSVARCDKPSLANTRGHACGMSSRIAYIREDPNPNVQWAVLCRKNELGSALTSEDGYWHEDNPGFALLGMIGFNSRSGEVAFVDGTDFDKGKQRLVTFDWSEPYSPPGGKSYDDLPGRSVAYNTYYYNDQIQCETCHDNKEPWIMTPHLKYAGIGYRDPERKAAFGLENPLPLVQPRSDEAPYRVIGTRYTKRADLTSKTFRDPTGSCTYCHTLTTDWTGKVLAYDAVGKVNEHQPYKSFFEKIDRAKTDWAKQPGNTHPWMVPWLGPNVNPGWEATPISEGSWRRIAACINETSEEDCQYRSVYTSCPAPEHTKTDCTREDEMAGTCTRLADPFGPDDLTVETSVPGDGDALPAGFNRKSTISWEYLNGLGGVPQRDDVRFNLLVYETKIPETGRAPDPGEFPDLATASDPFHADTARRGQIHYCDLERRRTRTCHILDPDAGTYFINNISFAGHLRNTTPPPATSPRPYQVHLPTRCNTRYLARLVPKRFCFDRSGVLAGKNDHLAWFDVTCNTN